MKNKNLKIAGLIGLAVIGMFALNRFYNQTADEKLVDKGLVEATPELPLTITVQGESKDSSVTYTFDGTKYMKYQQHPLVRFAPQEITKQEFDVAYQKYLL